MDARKLVTFVTPCFNEEGNVAELHRRVKEMMAAEAAYDWEHVFIDNASADRTVEVLRGLAAADARVKVIVNARNFGHIRSPHHAFLQARGDAVVCLVADLQDPPELVPQFLRLWEGGAKVVQAVKTGAEESPAMFLVRRAYYALVNRLSDVPLTKNTTGFGLYDRQVVEVIRGVDDPYPYFRGLVSAVGFKSAQVPYVQPSRRRGITSNNFYTLYDMAMLGITNHSKVPLRVATIAGFGMSALSLLLAAGYFAAKLAFWRDFPLGMAPVLIGLFFFSSVQLFFIGIIGEYVGAIHTQVLKRPLVVEAERINFDAPTRE